MTTTASPPVTDFSFEALAVRVRGLMSADVTFDAAIEIVHQDIKESEQLEEWWDAIGVMVISARVRKLVGAHRKGSPRRAYGGRRGKSWREDFANNPDAVWALEISLGTNGEKKAVGELTPNDIAAVVSLYHTEINRLTVHAELWGSIRRKMDPLDTLRVAWEAGRIHHQELEFIAERCFTDPVLLVPDDEAEGGE